MNTELVLSATDPPQLNELRPGEIGFAFHRARFFSADPREIKTIIRGINRPKKRVQSLCDKVNTLNCRVGSACTVGGNIVPGCENPFGGVTKKHFRKEWA